MSNKMNFSAFIFGLIISLITTTSVVYSNELNISDEDMVTTTELKIAMHNDLTDSHKHEIAKPNDSEPEVFIVNNHKENIDQDILNFRVSELDDYQKRENPNKVKLPENILNISSSVYVGSPIVSGDRESLYKGARGADLDNNIGAAFKLVILNK